MTRKTCATPPKPENRLRALGLSLLWAIFASPASAGPLGMVTPERWRPHAEVGVLDHVALRMHWYDSLELLRDAAVEHDVGPDELHGFSILRRDSETGAWVCDVFVVKMRGAFVDNDRTMTFGHELLHCFGLRHDD